MLPDLKKSVFSGVKWTALSAAVGAVFQIGQMIVLAYFLSPAEYGVWGILNVLIGFSQYFVDLGVSNAIIHYQDIDEEELSSLYWLNVMAGAALFLILSLSAPGVAAFYQTESLRVFIPLIALTFVLMPFGQQHQMLLQKEMRFKAISLIEIVTRAIGFTACIILLMEGQRLYAVIYSVLLSTGLMSVLLIRFHTAHRPRLIFKIHKIKKFLKFGSFQVMNGTLNYFNLQIDSLLIGRLLSMEALGFYTLGKNIALRILSLINPIVTRVTFPLMAKAQNDADLLKDTYLKTIAHLGTVNFPLYFFLVFFAEPVVLLLFGPKWLPAVPVLQILCVWAAFRSMSNPVGTLVLAKGRADWEFYWSLVLFLIVPVAIYLGSLGGIMGVCWSRIILQFALMVPTWFFLLRPLSQISFTEYYSTIFKAAVLALAAALGAYVLTRIFRVTGWMVVMTGVMTHIGLYFVLVKRFNSAVLLNVLQMLRLKS
jgi:O-antigen/teichoic acid export membrane protein